jgi:hypothetical protein
MDVQTYMLDDNDNRIAIDLIVKVERFYCAHDMLDHDGTVAATRSIRAIQVARHAWESWQMKRILIATAIAGLACASAHASPTRLPDTMLGWWCKVPEEEQTGHGSVTYSRQTELEDYCIKVIRRGSFSTEGGCNFTRIKKASPKSYLVYMRCGESGDIKKMPLSAVLFEMYEGKLRMFPVGMNNAH